MNLKRVLMLAVFAAFALPGAAHAQVRIGIGFGPRPIYYRSPGVRVAIGLPPVAIGIGGPVYVQPAPVVYAQPVYPAPVYYAPPPPPVGYAQPQMVAQPQYTNGYPAPASSTNADSLEQSSNLSRPAKNIERSRPELFPAAARSVFSPVQENRPILGRSLMSSVLIFGYDRAAEFFGWRLPMAEAGVRAQQGSGPLASLDEWDDDLVRRYPETGRAPDSYRNYDKPVRESVREFYRLNHRHQTLEFVLGKKAEYLPPRAGRWGFGRRWSF